MSPTAAAPSTNLRAASATAQNLAKSAQSVIVGRAHGVRLSVLGLIAGGQFQGGLSVGRTVNDTCLVVDSPEAARDGYCKIVPPWSAGTQLKFLVVYPLPWNLRTSAVYQNMAGIAYTLLFSYVGSSFAGILYSIYPLLWTLLGGAGTVLGPLVGTLVMTYVVDIASGFTTGYLLVVGVVLVAMILWAPAGIVGGIRHRWVAWLP